MNETRPEAPLGEGGDGLVVAKGACAGVFEHQAQRFAALLEAGRRDAWLLD